MPIKYVPPRLFGILARDAKAAIILRRGPSKWCQMVLWHIENDEIIRGQWVHHRIYERECDLSPDGKLVVYHAFDGRKRNRSPSGWFTAVSRPACFTPLVVWQYPLPGAGGLFTGNRELHIFSNAPLLNLPVPIPPPLLLSNKQTPFLDGPAERLRQGGWKCTKDYAPGAGPIERLWEKPHRRSKSVLIMRSAIESPNDKPGNSADRDEFSIRRQSDKLTPLTNVDWADIDQKQRLVFTREGRLFAAEFLPDGLRETLLADFTMDRPTEVPPPAWAKKWPKR